MRVNEVSKITTVNFAREVSGFKVNLVNARALLAPAIKNGFAIPFVNTRIFPSLIGDRFVGPSSVRSIIKAIQELKAPVGIEIAQSELKYCNISPENMVRHITEEASKAKLAHPIVIHFDHGSDTTKMEANVKAGFTSIAYDGGKCKDWDELITNTKAWVDFAHPRGISVEGEMETIGGMIATDPEKAKQFVRLTGIDILVVAFPGREHGAKKGESTIDKGILKEVRAAIPADVALNLHGGSGYNYEQLALAVTFGITKLNYATEVCKVMLEGTQFKKMLIDFENADPSDERKKKAEKKGLTTTPNVKKTDESWAKDTRNQLKTLFQDPEWLNMGKDMQDKIEEAGAEEIIRVSAAIGNKCTQKYYPI